jgi:hypothetical protein
MKFEPYLDTPLENALKAARDLRMALYDLASVYSSNDDLDRAGKMVEQKDILSLIEIELKKVDRQQVEALELQLKESGFNLKLA